MKVDFNNLRKQTAFALDKVIRKLNEGILPETEYVAHQKEDGRYKDWSGDVLIDKEELQSAIDELRQNVGILCCCYEEGNPDYISVYDEVEKSGGISWFNKEKEQV